MEARAGQQWQEKIHLLEVTQRETEMKIKELQGGNAASADQNAILSPAQEKALEEYRKTLAQLGKELKQVRKNLRRDTDALEFWTKVGNIATVPAFVAFSGLGLATVKSRKRSAR
jgi:hypothetical protein